VLLELLPLESLWTFLASMLLVVLLLTFPPPLLVSDFFLGWDLLA